MRNSFLFAVAMVLALMVESVSGMIAFADDQANVPVTFRNFVRAETDFYFSKQPLGKLHHNREMAGIDEQTVVRMNRDTLYSSGVFDLDAGPIVVTLPDSGKRFTSVQVISQDHYTIEVGYAPGRFIYTKDKIGTRYVSLLIRVLANPEDEADLQAAHAVQDAINIRQTSTGEFEVPNWDPVSQAKVRDKIKSMATAAMSLQDKMGPLASLRESEPPVMFGTKEEVDPIAHLVGTAVGWGGNPPSAAVYEGFVPTGNDGELVHKLTLKDVPVDGFWSVSVYNAEGFYEKNELDAYSLNNLTAKTDSDGSATIQFGGCETDTPNCLPITKGWNYTVRLYRPREEILDGSWTLPVAQPVS